MSLEQLADALRRRNLADADVARLLGRPAERGHIGEFLAEHIFDIQLEQSAVAKGVDGRFRSGPLAGASVNVKMYGKLEYLLDIRPDGIPDYYLVLTGPAGAGGSSRGLSRPIAVERVYLFAGPGLVQALGRVKLGVACSVKKMHWTAAEIYPEPVCQLLPLSEEQRKNLELFHPALLAPAARRVDPQGRYPSSGLRDFERVAEEILASHSDGVLRRTRDLVELEIGGEEGVLVVLTPEEAQVRLPSLDWTSGTHDPAPTSRLWRRSELDPRRLLPLIREGMALRASEFRSCRYCGARVPPEHRHGDDTCHGCAERHLGVVH